MPGAEWLALLCKDIPYRYDHLVRYVSGYATAAAGQDGEVSCISV